MIASPEGIDRGPRLYCEIGGATLELQAQDLTLAGVFVPTDDPFELDREVELTLHSPIGELNARCHVVQLISAERARVERRSAGCGMLFIDLEDDERAWIGLTLAALARAPQREHEVAARKPERETRRSRPPSARSEPAEASQKRSLPPPAPRRPQRASGPDRPQTLEQLQRELAAIQNRTPWAVLGLAEGADTGAARSAFLAMSTRYHPHAYSHLDSPEISRLATELFIAHKRAYSALGAMLRPIAVGNTAEPKSEPSPAGPARPNSLRPKAPSSVRPVFPPSVVDFCNEAARTSDAARAGRLTPAESLRPPAFSSSRPPAPHAAAGTRQRKSTSPGRPHARKRTADSEIAFVAALKHLAAARFDDATAELERALELNPDSGDAELWLRVCRARKLMANGQQDQALDAYRAVLEFDAEHREALAFVASVREAKKRPGLIGRWFGSEDD
jgi:hypothetical protein